MEVKILTPRKIEFDGEAEIIVLPTLSGEIAVLPQHTPLISVLKPGRMKVKSKTQEIILDIDGGVLQVSGNSAVVLLKNFSPENKGINS
jgi:F-type H+-transporting ATPase subunit epsilon